MSYQVDFFASIESAKNVLFWVMLQNTLSQLVGRIFTFDLCLLNLNNGGSLLHCTFFGLKPLVLQKLSKKLKLEVALGKV